MSLIGNSNGGTKKRGPASRNLDGLGQVEARAVNNRGIDARAARSTAFERRPPYRSSAAGGWTDGFHSSGFLGESVGGQATLD
ncbi:MAG: hypothetical protein OXG16_10445 [Rhodospirillales bacterium]|nr:hypothetical protein [Rhodospirillales bacterium]MDE0711809.1 hypothetical protein [Rhodospirillales bacterium]